MNKITVLGSINMDLVVRADRVPAGGETVFGSEFQTIPGGKGANQAVAIARQGFKVYMIARVGNDRFGQDLLNKLSENKIDTQKVKRDDQEPTGVALIIVETSGENRIIVISGANGRVSNLDVDDSSDFLFPNSFFVTQLENPMDTVSYAIKLAKKMGMQTVLNAAPAPTHPFDPSVLKSIDYLIVNETEAEAICGNSTHDILSATQTVLILQKMTNRNVVLTLGDKGAIAADGKQVWHQPAFKVNVVDTTASGDAFIAGLVTALSSGKSFQEAIIQANASGALAATKFGAQPSLPTIEDVMFFLDSKRKDHPPE
jgi:ribokinase